MVQVGCGPPDRGQALWIPEEPREQEGAGDRVPRAPPGGAQASSCPCLKHLDGDEPRKDAPELSSLCHSPHLGHTHLLPPTSPVPPPATVTTLYPHPRGRLLRGFGLCRRASGFFSPLCCILFYSGFSNYLKSMPNFYFLKTYKKPLIS